MIELRDQLNKQVETLSETSTEELADLLHLLERAYIHTMIEHGLRGVSEE